MAIYLERGTYLGSPIGSDGCPGRDSEGVDFNRPVMRHPQTAGQIGRIVEIVRQRNELAEIAAATGVPLEKIVSEILTGESAEPESKAKPQTASRNRG
jgi:hypothetical protein